MRIMITPKIYNENLKKDIVTDDMLSAAIYSVNKRAKNARDKEREYRDFYREHRYFSDDYGNEERARERKEYYYSLKDELLSFCGDKCTCIHRIGHERYQKKRIYSTQSEYYEVNEADVVWENCYYDRDLEMEVWFVDVIINTYINYEYFLFYDFGNYSFHHPINLDNVAAKDEQSELAKYGKEIVEIEDLETYGEVVSNLMSLNFVKKVLEVLRMYYRKNSL